jgi:hypothetical protein
MSDVAAAAQHYLKDEPLRRAAAVEGQRLVLAEHTWSHRAAKILGDLGLPIDSRRSGEAPPEHVSEAESELAHLLATGRSAYLQQ